MIFKTLIFLFIVMLFVEIRKDSPDSFQD